MSELDLRSLLGVHARRHSVPGAAVGLLRDSEVTAFYHGVADATTGEPVTPETRFAVGSLAKSMVATAVARLVEAGRLSLEDAVATHVPELRDGSWARRASVRDLLANRSRLALPAELEFEAFPGDDDGELSRFVSRVAAGEPTPPLWSYSNAGWAVLGRLLEAVTGLTWEAAMRAEVFHPLHMFGVRVPPLRLEPSHGAAADLSRVAGVYAWPDRRWEVAATGSSLVLETGGRSLVGLPIDDRTFVVDAADPERPQ